VSLKRGDLGVLGNLAEALGILRGGDANADWFAKPEDYLKDILANAEQRAALIAFVDEALGGADRSTESGIVWLPIVELDDPQFSVAMTVDESQADGLHIGVGLKVRTTAPVSATTLSIPLFRAAKQGSGMTGPTLLLGSVGGRIRIATSITIDDAPPVPGQAWLGGIGLDVDLPTSIAPPDPKGAAFGLSLTGLQLPGATTPRDVRVAGDGAQQLDDALLDLVLTLIKAQADAAAANTPIGALGGLLGLRSGDAVPDFPITQLPVQGVQAIAQWLQGVVTQAASRDAWMGYLANLLQGTAVAGEARFALGPATLTLSLAVGTGPTGHTLLTPRLDVRVGSEQTHVRALAELLRVDLLTGQAMAFPSLGLWAATGRAGAGNRVLDVAAPTVARADTLRVGFALDADRKLNFVLAADKVLLGAHEYETLDLSSPDAVMDAVGNTVGDVANELLGGLGAALGTARQLLGLDAPAGITALTLAALMSDPVQAVAGYWQQLIATPAAAQVVLTTLQRALTDASEGASVVHGTGAAGNPWRLPLIGPLALEVVAAGPVLTLSAALSTSIDTLGQRCTVVGTRLRATLARIDFAARSAQLFTGADASISARERGADPPLARLVLDRETELLADEVSLGLSWSPQQGLNAGVQAPNPRLRIADLELPLALPQIAADGSVTLPPEAWDAVQLLVGHLARLGSTQQSFLGDVVAALGWDALPRSAGGGRGNRVALRLAEFVAAPASALAQWLPRLLVSEVGPRALELVADLFAGAGVQCATFAGRGEPDDPYRVALAAGMPELLLWFPPAGIEPLLLAAPQVLRDWRPGQVALEVDVLEAALWAEAGVAPDIADLLVGRAAPGGAAGAIANGLSALAARWTGGDGRIVPPPTDPPGVDLRRVGLAAGQLWPRLDIEDLCGRIPTTTVHVALGAAAWPDAPVGRRIDLSAARLEATMFTLPAAAVGDWYVALGTRADCRPAGSVGDGTPEQALRLARVLENLSAVSTEIALVAVAGAGHAARVAAQDRLEVSDLVLLGTPLSAISLTAIDTQPTADALRLLQRLLPELPGIDDEPEDNDLALGRALVQALMELAERGDPGAELRQPVVPQPAPRAGLNVCAQFGVVSAGQVVQAMSAITASGLAERARQRVAVAAAGSAPPTGVRAGLRWTLPTRAGGQLAIEGQADLSLLAFDLSPGGVAARERVLRVRLRISDRSGWLSATPELGLRAVSADITVPLDGAATGSTRLTLHDARVFGQSWERLVLGTGPGCVPVLPEARVLLSALVQRLAADVAGLASVALADALQALGLVAAAGGVAADAVDQLVHDPGGLVRQRLALAGTELADALRALLGPLGAQIDFASGDIHVLGGGASAGRFGWSADVQVAPTGLSGSLKIGPDTALPMVGGLQLQLDLKPFSASLHWHHAGGGADTATLWPAPDAQALARMLAHAAPSLGAQAALELLRRADEQARPLIDALLDALGLLGGIAGDAQRALRPLAGLLRDPVGWLRSAGSLASNPARIQALIDALRPLMGLAGMAGSPLELAKGVALAVATDGPGARLELSVDPSGWLAPAGGGARLAGGIAASLKIGLSGAPTAGLALQLGLPGAAAGRQAVHAAIGAQGLSLFLRPASGADIPLVPFAGLGSLAAAAEAALPFLLDKLAEQAAPVGPLVQKVGDALALRSGAPSKFDAVALRAWAEHPVAKLQQAAPSIIASGVSTLATLLDDFMPAAVTASHSSGTLQVGVGVFALGWTPGTGRVALSAASLSVPGISELSFTLALSHAGLDELSLTLGPAIIDAGGVELRPYARIVAGQSPASARCVMLGLAANGTQRFAARWLLGPPLAFDLVASDGAIHAALDSTAPAQVALRIVEVVADLVAAVAMAQAAVQDLLAQPVGAIDVRNLLRGVLLDDVADPAGLDDHLFDPSRVGPRVRKLIDNIAKAGISIPIDGLTLSFLELDGQIGLQVGLASRFALITGDVMLWLENDDSWIAPNPAGDGGLFVGFMPAGALAFAPSLVVNGLGLRLGRASGPLLDAGLSIESVALHAFAAIDSGGAHSGGVQLQFANLAVSAGGAGGSNGIAQGVMRDTGPTPPKPAFSPALAIQKHGPGSVAVTLRAGDPPGPWWIAIQKGFGPLYLEQVGFDAPVTGGRIQRISLLMDGSVSMFGLTCAVDDLQITYFTADGDFFDANQWKVDLAGLAVSADMAGVSIAGGLLKQVSQAGTAQESIEYLGMLLGRFAVYGLTIYGGYSEGHDDSGQKFTAFFAVGAVNGPIGGPPAFFLTGIGGGFGINRLLRVPTDLSNFGDYPLIQALDIAASPSDPMTQLRALGSYFPMKKGMFWFAAGLSFNSFALVDGIAVVGVQVGDGLDINLLGLARMALPRPQVALVSIEVALLVRFSSSEGVLWVQGQLTDNSWLLYPDIKLTGGFAYVIWFKGERAGEFVLTLGGYHPDFHRAGYPQVPRLGLRWSIGSNIVIKAGSYFALTSEALMAGGDFEGSATFGPAWAEVKFGAHGIVYFDPFHYRVNAYARIAAGITIDTWIFGEITISISLGARIDVEGPDFHGSVTFEVGPVELTFDFGGPDKAQRQPISADAFILKYLEPAEDGSGALAHALMTAAGALPAKGDKATPDGSSTRPFVVVVEFSMTLTSTVPATRVRRVSKGGEASTAHAPSRALAVAPMLSGSIQPEIVLTWLRGGETQAFPFAVTPRPFGRFPLGVWGPAGDPNNRKVPQAEMVEALNELDLVCSATPSAGGPEIPYHQVEIGPRKPLPFTRRAAEVSQLRGSALSIATLVSEPASVDSAFATATRFLGRSATPTALAALRGERQAPPRPGTLAEGLETPTETVIPAVAEPPAGKVYDHVVDAPMAVGLLAGATADVRVGSKARTTVKDSARAWRTAPPTLAAVMAERSHSIAARLVLVDEQAVTAQRGGRGARGTLIAAAEVPPTAVARAPTAVVARTGAPLAAPLTDFSAALAAGGRTRGAGATLGTGQTVVLQLPNAKADAAEDATRPSLAVAGAAARVVLIGLGGQRLSDQRVGPSEAASSLVIPRGTERIVAIGLGGEEDAAKSRGARAGLAGWHAGLLMPYVGWSSAIAPGCVLQSTTDRIALHRERVEAGWVSGAELVRGVTTLSTTFSEAPRTVLIVLDDPAVTGEAIEGRRLLLGLDGAARATDTTGAERAPVLLSMDNRSVLAYDIVPELADAGAARPVVVSVASEEGWSLVGVMGSASLDAASALALVAARGLDAALLPLASREAALAGAPSRLSWQGPVRTDAQRRAARARATGLSAPRAPRALRAAAAEPVAAKTSSRKGR
jgi:hypothetical protein